MSHFHQELEGVRKQLIAMGGLVEVAIRDAVAALAHRRRDLIMGVIEGDKRVDAMENDIDATCHRMLALYQPVAGDLRLILTAMKVNNELERMGDHAKNIARAAAYLDDHEPLPVYSDLEDISRRVVVMVKQSLDAAITSDVELAHEVRTADRAVDEAHIALMERAEKLMYDNREAVSRGVHLINACRNLERIGDLAVNIAKDVIFMVSGDQVRHGGASTATLNKQP
jgi:phosphate transport system protein